MDHTHINNNKLYIIGDNDRQIGETVPSEDHIYEPAIVPGLKNIIDIKSSVVTALQYILIMLNL